MLAAVAIAGGGLIVTLLVALLVAFCVYAVGVYLFHAPQPVVGLVALLVFVLLLLAGV